VFKASVAEPVESYLYRPAIAGYLALVRTAKRLQSGRLEAYVGYMLLALIAVLIVAASMR
jgi:ascorbate-specific PTS system EIIC-type component UlaA